ncbi:MAG: host-nuclease inhibitor Gam family protein [Luteolibacter sp.]|uniref:host-nuclease inhibitor Gam family protein n=1 Tax=Luteolibacter sp. TaxID=1962973 RepID=UPI003267923F
MPAKPKKAKLPAIETNDQLHNTVDEIARLEVRLRGLEAKRDVAIQLVRAEHDEQIEADNSRLASLLKLAATYANCHRESLFTGGLKSAACALARFGFRSGNPTLKTLNKKWTWEKILAELKIAKKYFRSVTTEEVDKEAIKAAKLTDVELAALGLRIDSGETFYVESKSDEADRLSTTAEPQPAVV